VQDTAVLAALVPLTHLHTLTLHQPAALACAPAADAFATLLSSHSASLRRLSLPHVMRHASVSGTLTQALAQLSHLTSLDISAAALSSNCPLYLAQLTNLEVSTIILLTDHFTD
jgi:hypothetical protein